MVYLVKNSLGEVLGQIDCAYDSHAALIKASESFPEAASVEIVPPIDIDPPTEHEPHSRIV